MSNVSLQFDMVYTWLETICYLFYKRNNWVASNVLLWPLHTNIEKLKVVTLYGIALKFTEYIRYKFVFVLID